MKFSAYYFHMKTKTLADFQICISVPLRKTFRGNLYETISTNEIASFRFPLKVFPKRKLYAETGCFI